MRIRIRCISCTCHFSIGYGPDSPVRLEGAALAAVGRDVWAGTPQVVLSGRLRVAEPAARSPFNARPGASAVRSQSAREHASAGRERLFPDFLIAVWHECASISHLGVRYANGQPGLAGERGFTDDIVPPGGLLGANSMDRQYRPRAGDVLDLDLQPDPERLLLSAGLLFSTAVCRRRPEVLLHRSVGRIYARPGRARDQRGLPGHRGSLHAVVRQSPLQEDSADVSGVRPDGLCALLVR